jgi:aminoglycoside phosphotransferase (APT) family kinase protein
LDYRRDLESAAGLFARLHSLDVPGDNHRLICEDRPLTGMYEECARLADVYLRSDLADPFVRQYLSEVLTWAGAARAEEAYYLSDPCPCVINTEVNSGNFIVNRQNGTIHLVDWEKPLWGDPSQDLSHFSVPTTTLWKTEYRMPTGDRRRFLDAYRCKLANPHLRDTIVERVRLRDPFNCLRGVSWSAMAWVGYQTGAHALRNADTFRKLQAYLEPAFLRSLFDPYLC